MRNYETVMSPCFNISCFEMQINTQSKFLVKTLLRKYFVRCTVASLEDKQNGTTVEVLVAAQSDTMQ